MVDKLFIKNLEIFYKNNFDSIDKLLEYLLEQNNINNYYLIINNEIINNYEISNNEKIKILMSNILYNLFYYEDYSEITGFYKELDQDYFNFFKESIFLDFTNYNMIYITNTLLIKNRLTLSNIFNYHLTDKLNNNIISKIIKHDFNALILNNTYRKIFDNIVSDDKFIDNIIRQDNITYNNILKYFKVIYLYLNNKNLNRKIEKVTEYLDTLIDLNIFNKIDNTIIISKKYIKELNSEKDKYEILKLIKSKKSFLKDIKNKEIPDK